MGPTVFLASPASDYVTGVEIVIDGGGTRWGCLETAATLDRSRARLLLITIARLPSLLHPCSLPMLRQQDPDDFKRA